MIRLALALLLPLLLSACAPTLVARTRTPTAGYLIQDVTVFTGEADAPLLHHMDVLVLGDRIAAVSTERLDVPGARVIEGDGLTLLPGLTDSHTHITSGMLIRWQMAMPATRDFNLRAALYSGITAVVDMGGYSTDRMVRLADQLEDGSRLGPRLVHAGMGFTGEGAHPIPMLELVADNISPALRGMIPDLAIEVSTPDDLDEIDTHLDAGPDFTKVFLDRIPPTAPTMDPAVLDAIVARSHGRGVPVFVHVGYNADVAAVLDAGADGLAHVVYKEALTDELVQGLADQGVVVIPTAVVFDNYAKVTVEQSFDHYSDLEWQTTPPGRKRALRNPQPVDEHPDWVQAEQAAYDNRPHLHGNVAALHAAGVTLLAGSDSPNLGLTAGGALHVELQHLVAAGLTPTEALLAATSVPAREWSRLTGRPCESGTVAEGMRADLLLVRGDPTADITATQDIAEVFLAGVRLRRIPPR